MTRSTCSAPRPSLGSSVCALNHPQGSENLERAPKEPASRAEAAYSLAKLRTVDPARIAAIQQLASSFAVPALTDLQREVLARALRFVGYPYVFAGMSEKTQKLWSATAPGNTIGAPGGFDCSGFVWRIYKLQPFDDAPALAAVLRGRTSYAMSGEVARPQRIDPGALQPADVLFFGSRGPKSKPSEVGHMGIYVGNGWFVHSSSGGVTLQPLQGWYATTLAWARRPLAEAGLACSPRAWFPVDPGTFTRVRWKKVPGQGDMEDRRGQSSGPLGGGGFPIPMGAGGGGLGLIIIVVLALLFGGNIFGGGGSSGPLTRAGSTRRCPRRIPARSRGRRRRARRRTRRSSSPSSSARTRRTCGRRSSSSPARPTRARRS